MIQSGKDFQLMLNISLIIVIRAFRMLWVVIANHDLASPPPSQGQNGIVKLLFFLQFFKNIKLRY